MEDSGRFLNTSIKTRFHRLAPEIVVAKEEGLRRAICSLEQAEDVMPLYEGIIQAHLPLAPLAAKVMTCERNADIANKGSLDPERGRQLFDSAIFQVDGRL